LFHVWQGKGGGKPEKTERKKDNKAKTKTKHNIQIRSKGCRKEEVSIPCPFPHMSFSFVHHIPLKGKITHEPRRPTWPELIPVSVA